ncbi:MAG: sporulation integral membrane protein YlbJ [Halanaerobiales bacterium]
MNKERKHYKIVITALLAVFITILVIIYSENAFNAAVEGLKVWWEIVFPSLLPFFIIAEILMGLGVVHFLGALLEPLMRPLFKVPGVGAFAMAMGLASGYPIGAKITANLRLKKLCTKTEGERLVSFTNTADPLFMIGAVAVGMFHRADLAIIIAGSHYISSILIGFIMRFYKGNKKSHDGNKNVKRNNSNNNIFSTAYYELINARYNDGRNFGELMGDAVKESIHTLLLIGGFIILFSVITEMIVVTGLVNIIGKAFIIVLQPLKISGESILPLISGFFEITNGANMASQTTAPLLEKLIITNAVIAWSGLSVHAQVATMVNNTDIKLKPYIFARILQAVFASVITVIIYVPFSQKVSEVMSYNTVDITALKNYLTYLPLLVVVILLITVFISLLIYFLRKVKIIIFHHH